MRQYHLIRRMTNLRRQGQVTPAGLNKGVRQNRIAYGQQVKIKRSHAPSYDSLAPETRLDPVQGL